MGGSRIKQIEMKVQRIKQCSWRVMSSNSVTTSPMIVYVCSIEYVLAARPDTK